MKRKGNGGRRRPEREGEGPRVPVRVSLVNVLEPGSSTMCWLTRNAARVLKLLLFFSKTNVYTGGSMARRNTYVCERTTDRYTALQNGKDSRWVSPVPGVSS